MEEERRGRRERHRRRRSKRRKIKWKKIQCPVCKLQSPTKTLGRTDESRERRRRRSGIR